MIKYNYYIHDRDGKCDIAKWGKKNHIIEYT